MRGQINPLTKVFKIVQKKIDDMSNNRPLGNYYGVLKEYLIGHVLKGQNDSSTRG